MGGQEADMHGACFRKAWVIRLNPPLEKMRIPSTELAGRGAIGAS